MLGRSGTAIESIQSAYVVTDKDLFYQLSVRPNNNESFDVLSTEHEKIQTMMQPAALSSVLLSYNTVQAFTATKPVCIASRWLQSWLSCAKDQAMTLLIPLVSARHRIFFCIRSGVSHDQNISVSESQYH